MRRRSAAVASAVVLAAVVAVPPAQAQDDAELPVAGTFGYRLGNSDEQPLVRGAVHAVRRVPGGTAVYWSLGVPAGQRWTPTATMPPPGLSDDYRAGDGWSVALVEPGSLRYYQPMVGPDGCLCLRPGALGRDDGVLHTSWAVVPELPPDVRTVSVRLAFGVQVDDVPVEDGALEPAVDAPSTVLGEGWPALPDATGDDAYNDRLSLARAEAVAAALRSAAGSDLRLTAGGRGEDEPVADDATDEGRARNRRVTVTYAVEPS